MNPSTAGGQVMCGEIVSLGFAAEVDVNQGVDGEGEGVDRVVGDRLSDLMPLAHGQIGVDGILTES